MNDTIDTPRIVFPTIPVTSPDFTYARGADVQSTWRKFGWVPPSEARAIPEQSQGACNTSQL